MVKIKKIIMILLIAIVTIALVPKEFQNDTFFTIAIGEKILNNEDVNSLVWHEDVKFVHSGYFDLIIANIYNAFSFTGIYVFVIIISVFQMLIYNYILNKITNKSLLSFILTLVTVYFNYSEFAARAQVISFTLFLIEFYCIENITKTFKKRYAITLIIIPILLANLHSSVFPVCFAIYLPYIAEFILSKIKLKQSDDSKIIIEKRNGKVLFSLFALTFLLAFCTPTGTSAYTDMFKAMKGFSPQYISELLPLDIMGAVYFVFLNVLIVGIVSFTKIKIRVVDCFFILGFGLMSITTTRCIFFFYLISSICVYRTLNDFIDEYNIKLFKNKFTNFICVISVLFIIVYSTNLFISKFSENYVNTGAYPVEATDYILENIDIEDMKIFNNFNYGSYLEFRGIPVFIDSRSGMFTPEFNKGVTVLGDWYNVWVGAETYKTIFDKYEITHALIEIGSVANNYIIYDEEWNLLYQDANFAFYEKVK